MLVNRVTSALVKFLAPVSSSTDSALDSDRTTAQNTSQKSIKPAKPDLKLVKSPGQSNGKKHHDKSGHGGSGQAERDPSKPKSPKLVMRLVDQAAKTPQEAATVEEFLNLPQNHGEVVETAESTKFIHLFSHFQKQRSQLQQKIGLASYQEAATQKTMSLFKKGSILDVHVD